MLRIDKEGLIKAIILRLQLRLNAVAELAVQFMQGEIAKLPSSGSHDSTGASDWRLDVIDAIKFKGISAGLNVMVEFGLVDADELTLNRALLINYGMGRTLSRDNPYLSEYESSEYFDNKRNGYSVYTRPDEEIYDYESGGWYVGTTRPRVEIESFWQTPSEFFETAFEAIQDDFWRVVYSPFEGINFSKYVYVR